MYATNVTSLKCGEQAQSCAFGEGVCIRSIQAARTTYNCLYYAIIGYTILYCHILYYTMIYYNIL